MSFDLERIDRTDADREFAERLVDRCWNRSANRPTTQLCYDVAQVALIERYLPRMGPVARGCARRTLAALQRRMEIASVSAGAAA